MWRISAHAYSLLEKEGLYPNGLILEAPFTKMSEEMREYPLSRVIFYFNYYTYIWCVLKYINCSSYPIINEQN